MPRIRGRGAQDRRPRAGRLVPFLLLGAACAAGDAPPTPAGEAFARFRIEGPGLEGDFRLQGDTSLVQCSRDAGWADLWIRFAGDTAAAGNAGPHLDIDLCGLGEGGSFAPQDPRATSCDGSRRWVVWWHEDGATFTNPPEAAPCTLTIDREDEGLTGRFSCRGLVELEGARTVDVLDGDFRCSIR